MSAVNATRVDAPQAFVSSFAPRMRMYGNSLLAPIQPQLQIPPLRTTKRGTTAINYAEEFEDDSIEDSDGLAGAGSRRATGLRTAQQRKEAEDVVRREAEKKELGREAKEPVDVQGIWREWMGKPKRNLTERQMHVQAVLPTTLVPIRIDLDVTPFRPEAALPTPQNAKDFGIDESLSAYKPPEVTPQYRLKDSFLWNLHEALITPDQYAKVFVDELDFPVVKKQGFVLEIANQIRQQLEEHAATALHPFFQPSYAHPVHAPPTTTNAASPAARPATASREESSTPLPAADTPTTNPLQAASHTNGYNHHQHHNESERSSPMPNGTSTPAALAVTAQALPKEPPASLIHNPPDTHRCILTLSINLQNRLYTDKFEWSLLHPSGLAETFAKQTCADLGLSGEWVPHMAHAILEASLRLKKEMVENGGTLAGVVGSGVDGYGNIENEACDYHGTAEPAFGVGAGWRFDEDATGAAWEPRIEVLSKEEIERREGDRERQLRRARRETARFTTTYALQAQGSSFGNDYFSGGLGSSSLRIDPEDERMGRGERSKKKRRFRSLSPVGRDTPEIAGFGGTSQQLTEGERQYWTCSHCKVWGTAVWGVRDGPSGSRTLCHNCGWLYERDKKLPVWNYNLFAGEKSQGRSDVAMPHGQGMGYQQAPPQHQQTMQQFRPQPQYHHQQQSSADIAAFPQGTPLPPRSSNYSTSADLNINPSSHLYTGASLTRSARNPSTSTSYEHSTGQGQISASTMADIVNYAEPGEDLDWTQITEPRERKRLQNIINGRKYRERRLAAEGLGGSGGNYPGAAGTGSVLSMGYGSRKSALG